MWDRVKSFVSEHPWGTAGIVFVIGVILIYLFWPRSSGTATGTQDLSPYYNAQAAAIGAGGEVYAAQIGANASTAIAVKNADTAVQLATIAAGVSNHQTDSTLDAIRAQTSAELSAYFNNNSTTVDLAHIAADTERDVSANALMLGSKQLDINLAEVNSNNNVINNANTYAYNLADRANGYNYNLGYHQADLAYALGSHNADLNYMTGYNAGNWNYSYGMHKLDVDAGTTSTLAWYDQQKANSAAAWDYQKSVDLSRINSTTQLATDKLHASSGLAALIAVLSQGAGGVYGAWTPDTGQITIANSSSYGGPIDPATLAQIAQYPWLRGG